MHAGALAGTSINQRKKDQTRAQILPFRLYAAFVPAVLLPSTVSKQIIQSAEGKMFRF